MRIEINTNGKPITDKDVRVLYQIADALNNSTARMKVANLAYFADRLGYKLIKKGSHNEQ
jgi:hypothetical protein